METLHSHGNIFIFIFIFIFYLYIPFLSLATDIITPTQPLTMNQTLISSRKVFELGFFNLTNNNLYIGIWYLQIQPKTIVWVANCDAPINSSFGKLTIGNNGNINLLDRSETTIWSTNQSVVPVVNTVAQLLDSGNFVVRRENDENPKNYIWQSFDYPTDTFLSGMKLGLTRTTGIERILRSWKADNDPGSGNYSYRMKVSGFPELVLRNKENITYRSGPWNGITFSGTPEMNRVTLVHFEFRNTFDEIYFSYEMVNISVYSRVIVTSLGNLQRFYWMEATKTWRFYWQFPLERCDNYNRCGPFGVCDANSFPICKCLYGFQPRDEYALSNLQDGSNGCVRTSKLDCGSDEFLPLKNVKLPESSKAFTNGSMNLSDCGEICKRNCSCTAYVNMYVTGGGSGCVIWVVDLIDMKQYGEYDGGGQDLYVRVAASDLDKLLTTRNSKKGYANGNHVVKIVVVVVSICAGLFTLLIILYLKKKMTRRLKKSITLGIGPQERTDGETKMDELDLPLFDLTTLAMATNNFSEANKLGQGGFGCVYKGTLPRGEVVAVKRLSRVSDQRN